ncbi:MAG: PaaI family thioesterase [Alphaproteobacteria bacterium]|nr:PaaI family thioesterase [Alphaproteobacteria bacterium]
MPVFEPRDPNFQERIATSFANQPFISLLGCELQRVAPGEIDIRMAFRPEHAQQHGYVHGGAMTAIADAAAGYAAMTLAGPGTGVLTTELKVNFLRPAGRGALVAKGRVIKPGRSLNICQADVFEEAEGEDIHVLTGLVTMMFMPGLEG